MAQALPGSQREIRDTDSDDDKEKTAEEKDWIVLESDLIEYRRRNLQVDPDEDEYPSPRASIVMSRVMNGVEIEAHEAKSTGWTSVLA